MFQNALEVHFSREERAYTGRELRPHFLLTELGIRGSAIGAFIGRCRVETEHLVDWEDRLAKDRIEAARMVHFIGEFFGMGLREGVVLQRLFMASVAESLNAILPPEKRLRRDGDDIFLVERKLSVSIVTASPVSLLLHTGINIDPAGAPVPAIGLNELGVRAEEWVPVFLESFAAEWGSVHWACAKVRPVV